MKRRRLCAWGIAAACALPLPLRAQRQRKARLGVLTDMALQDPVVQRMLTRLAELGWAEMRNLTIDYQRIDTSDPAGIAAMVRAMVDSRCELILAHTTPAALAVRATAPSMPMVFAGIGGDPVALGLVASLARPGGNATGWTLAAAESELRLVSLLRDVAPRAKSLAVLFNAGNASSLQAFEQMKAHASSSGLALRGFPLRDYKDADAAELAFVREPVDGLVVVFNPVTPANRVNIVAVASRRRLPAVYGSRYFVDDGGLLSYGVNWPAQFMRSAEYIARILDGAKPADLPVERPTEFELVVNLRTARLQGISVPQSVLLQATEVMR